MMRPSPSAIICRTTYFVRMIGDRMLRRSKRLDLGVVHGGEQALGADPGIVDEAVDGAEFVAQSLSRRPGWRRPR